MDVGGAALGEWEEQLISVCVRELKDNVSKQQLQRKNVNSGL